MNYIYKIISPSGSIYIGKSHDIRTRFYRYKNLHCKGQPKLYHSLRWYGFDAHEIEIIELPATVTKELLSIYEIWFIAKFKSNYNRYPKNKGMNMTDGGDSTRGHKHTQETKTKMSKRLIGNTYKLGKKESEESNRKRSAKISGKNHPFWGKKLSEETRRKISIGRIGKYGGDKNPNYGKKHTEETRKKIGAILRGRKQSAELVAKKAAKVKKPISQFTKSGEFIRNWDSATDVQRTLNIHSPSIAAVCRGKLMTSGGFKWQYVDKNKLIT